MVAVVGLSYVGKTTIRNRLSFDSSETDRTQIITAKIISLQTNPQTYVGILDGGGDKLPQQFSIAQQCDCLCIFLDHNQSDHDANIDSGRLEKHKELMNQIRLYLDEYKAEKKTWINLVVNKKDLWGNIAEDRKRVISEFYKDELNLWLAGNRASIIEIRNHTNNSVQDLARFMERLTQIVIDNPKVVQ